MKESRRRIWPGMNGLLFFYSSFCDSQMIGAGRPLGQSAQQSIGQQSTGARLQTTDGRVERPIVVVGRAPCVSTKGWASERGRKEGVSRTVLRKRQLPPSHIRHRLLLLLTSLSISPPPPILPSPRPSSSPQNQRFHSVERTVDLRPPARHSRSSPLASWTLPAT